MDIDLGGSGLDKSERVRLGGDILPGGAQITALYQGMDHGSLPTRFYTFKTLPHPKEDNTAERYQYSESAPQTTHF